MSLPPASDPPPSETRNPLPAKTALLLVMATGIAFSACATWFWGIKVGLSVTLGAFIAIANLYGLIRIVTNTFQADGEARTSGRGWALFAIVKMLALFGGMFLLLRSGLVHPLALLAGYSTLFIGITCSGAFGQR